MIEAKLPDGTTLEFPDGTDRAVIQRVVKQQLGIKEDQPEASGMLQTFAEAAAQSASFDQYDSMKASLKGTTEKEVQQQLDRDWEANPWSGRAGWLAGMIGGGGAIGAGVKGGVKLGAKALGKGAQYANAADKAAKWAKRNPKKAIAAGGAAGGAAYDTTYRLLNEQEVTPGTVGVAGGMGLLGGLGGAAITNKARNLIKGVPEKKTNRQLIKSAENKLRDSTVSGTVTRADIDGLRKFVKESSPEGLRGTKTSKYETLVNKELSKILNNLDKSGGSLPIKNLNSVKKRLLKEWKKASDVDKELLEGVNKKIKKLINKRNLEHRESEFIRAKFDKASAAAKPGSWSNDLGSNPAYNTDRTFNNYMSAASIRQTMQGIKGKLKKADTAQKRRNLQEDGAFRGELEKLRKVSPEVSKEIDRFFRTGVTRRLTEMLSKVGAFGMGTMLAHAVASPGTLGFQLGGMLAAKQIAPKMHMKRYRAIKDASKLESLPDSVRKKVREQMDIESRKGKMKSGLWDVAPGSVVGGNLSSGLFSDGEY